MKKSNKENVTKLVAAISDADYNFGECELRDEEGRVSCTDWEEGCSC